MKVVINTSDSSNSEMLFTPAAVLGLLAQIDELKDKNVGITEAIDGKIQIQVGNSIYYLNDDSVTDVQVDETVVDTVDDVNQSAYQELTDSGEIDIQEPVESGILKELGKSLMLGGLIRLSGKLLK